MFYFLNEQQGGAIVRAGERRKLYFSDPMIGYDLLTPDFSRQMMSVLIRLNPYARRIAMPLAKTTEQWMHVLEGQMEIIIGDESYILEIGDTIYYDGDLLREFSSVNDQELVIICCVSPPAL